MQCAVMQWNESEKGLQAARWNWEPDAGLCIAPTMGTQLWLVAPPSWYPGGSLDAGAQPHQSALEGRAAPAQESGRAGRGAQNTLDSHWDGLKLRALGHFRGHRTALFFVCHLCTWMWPRPGYDQLTSTHHLHWTQECVTSGHPPPCNTDRQQNYNFSIF